VIDRRAVMASALVGLLAAAPSPAHSQVLRESQPDLANFVLRFFQTLVSQRFDELIDFFSDALVQGGGTGFNAAVFNNKYGAVDYLYKVAGNTEYFLVRDEPVVFNNYLICALCDIQRRPPLFEEEELAADDDVPSVLSGLRRRPWLFVFSIISHQEKLEIVSMHVVEGV
jgi:hypothetical protein